MYESSVIQHFTEQSIEQGVELRERFAKASSETQYSKLCRYHNTLGFTRF